jgi:hypothetical protein
MLRTILVYGAVLGASAFGLQWLEYQFLVRTYSTEVYVALVAVTFMALGVWVGARLFHRTPTATFEANTRVQETLAGR